MFSFSAHLLFHPSFKLATTDPKPTQDASYECQPILIPTVCKHGQLRALHCYVRLMPRPIDHHAAQFRPHACPYIPHRLVFGAPKSVSSVAHGRFRSPGGVPVRRGRSSGLAPSFRSGRAVVGGSGCVCVDPGPSFYTQRDFVPTHAFRPVAAGGVTGRSLAGAAPSSDEKPCLGRPVPVSKASKLGGTQVARRHLRLPSSCTLCLFPLKHPSPPIIDLGEKTQVTGVDIKEAGES